MRLLVRAVAYLALAAVLALLGFAIFSDLPAPRREISLPIEAR